MRKFLIFVALWAVCCAAPTEHPPNVSQKPHSIVALGLLQHDGNLHHSSGLDRPSPINPEVVSDPKPASIVIAHDEPQKSARHARDIPVPTQVKTTSAPKEEKEKEKPQVEETSTSRPDGPLRHRPVPVAELFSKPKSQPAASSAENKESKESDESKEGKV
ncbi:hypothetical protein AWZ03_000827 [Drosophila navojoa]|uniref:DUF4794 domain-containing protein n=1 Tax=Drosophila navojoa TaxID=7232 RepID=A0A484BV99_DRONA|nr:uncharacterized protein LOC108651085 [Drosophila navojoa]TDG52594.1 hypothetical protein AWZ03_000827 [Drosophila navojoa]